MKNIHQSWLVPLEIAKSLKEIGFNKPCIFSYSEGIGVTACLRSGAGEEPLISDFVVSGNMPNSPFVDLPTWEQVFEWFREKGLHSFIKVVCTNLEFDKRDAERLKNPITFYKYVKGKDALGTFSFSIQNYSEISSYNTFGTYEKCREELVKSLIDDYKKLKIK